MRMTVGTRKILLVKIVKVQTTWETKISMRGVKIELKEKRGDSRNNLALDMIRRISQTHKTKEVVTPCIWVGVQCQ
jgi:hypothetical protein